MKLKERIKLFKVVFSPKSGEKVLFLMDIPHGDITDSQMWKDRRKMAKDWYNTFKEMGTKAGFTVEFMEYKSTGIHNAPLSNYIIKDIRRFNLVIAMPEYSITSSLLPICADKDTITRCASMPGIEKRMEETALRADYAKVQKYAAALKKMLEKAIGAEVTFSTGDKLYMDLRNRNSRSEAGDCTKTGQFINFPSGEACKVPYEATQTEVSKFGESKTEGVSPVIYNGELVKYIIKNNRIVEVLGDGKKAEEMRKFFRENDTRRNIAEFAIGCNPKAVITGNILEDEKVEGLHIAYGTSTFIGGNIQSDMHQDIVYTKGCPVEATTIILDNKDGSKTELIKDTNLRYDLLK